MPSVDSFLCVQGKSGSVLDLFKALCMCGEVPVVAGQDAVRNSLFDAADMLTMEVKLEGDKLYVRPTGDFGGSRPSAAARAFMLDADFYLNASVDEFQLSWDLGRVLCARCWITPCMWQVLLGVCETMRDAVRRPQPAVIDCCQQTYAPRCSPGVLHQLQDPQPGEHVRVPHSSCLPVPVSRVFQHPFRRVLTRTTYTGSRLPLGTCCGRCMWMCLLSRPSRMHDMHGQLTCSPWRRRRICARAHRVTPLSFWGTFAPRLRGI